MRDGNLSMDGLRRLSEAGLSRFAADVMARVAARGSGGPVALREPLLASVMASVRAQGADPLDLVLAKFERARVSTEVLADHYIPEVARRLGRAWENDMASFAEVSIGSARLQAHLNELGRSWQADGTDGVGRSTLLLVVPEGEQHTLGARVVSGWMRRQGISVCLRVGPKATELAALLAQCRFDAAMISVACHERLESCTGLVKTLREETSNGLRIALGGAILGRGEDIETVAGVDIVTNDLPKAVEALDLSCKRPLVTVIT